MSNGTLHNRLRSIVPTAIAHSISHTSVTWVMPSDICPNIHLTPSLLSTDRMCMSGHNDVTPHDPTTTATCKTAIATTSTANSRDRRRVSVTRFFRSDIHILLFICHKIVYIEHTQFQRLDHKTCRVYTYASSTVREELLHEFVLPLFQTLHAKRHTLEV